MVDDVHLSNRFGELLQALASSLRSRVAGMARSERSQSGNLTPSNLTSHRQQFQGHDGVPADMTNSMVEAYHPSTEPAGGDNKMLPNPDYDGRPCGVPGTTTDTQGYLQMQPPSGITDQNVLQSDPLISFAGLGPNQLGWSGGQDFFDMLGPLLDVQYEQYR